MKNRQRVLRMINRLKKSSGIDSEQSISQESFLQFEEKVVELLLEKELENKNLIHSLEIGSSEVKRNMDELRKQQEVNLQTSKMAAIGEMASSISHEINNPLQIIQLAADSMLAREDEDNPYSEPLKKQIQKIIKTVKRVSLIILSLKKLSHEQSNDGQQIVDLSGVINEVMILSEQKLKSYGIEVKYDQPADPVEVLGNFQQLSIVFMNLFSNAFDAIEFEEVDDRWIKIEVFESENETKLNFINGGSKIPEELSSKIFESFFTTKEVGKGTGIGLSISQKILSAVDATLELDTTNDNTCFCIRFPKES